MNKIEVIYARQSVDKRDSISIETQINDCKKKLDSENFNIFYDKGYSGKSTDRPQFQEMMNEVRKGIVSKIIIYKFDRISRSLIDFLSMQQDFSKYGVKQKAKGKYRPSGRNTFRKEMNTFYITSLNCFMILSSAGNQRTLSRSSRVSHRASSCSSRRGVPAGRVQR